MKLEKFSFLILFGFIIISCHTDQNKGQLQLYFSDQFKQFEQIELFFFSENSIDSLSCIVNTGTDSIKVILNIPYGFWNLAIFCNNQFLTDQMKTQIDISESQSPLLVDLKAENRFTIQPFQLTNERILIESENAIWINKAGTYQFEKLINGGNSVWLNRQQIAFHDYSGASLNIFDIREKQLIRSIDIREYQAEGNNMVYWPEKQSFAMVGKSYHNVILLSVDEQVSQFKFKEIVISMIPQRGSDNLLILTDELIDGLAISSFHIPSGQSIRLLSQEPGYKISYFDYYANSRLLIVSTYHTKKADDPATGYVAELYRLTESGLVKINSHTDSQFVFTYPDFSSDGSIYFYGNSHNHIFRTDTLFSKFELISAKKVDHFDSF